MYSARPLSLYPLHPSLTRARASDRRPRASDRRPTASDRRPTALPAVPRLIPPAAALRRCSVAAAAHHHAGNGDVAVLGPPRRVGRGGHGWAGFAARLGELDVVQGRPRRHLPRAGIDFHSSRVQDGSEASVLFNVNVTDRVVDVSCLYEAQVRRRALPSLLDSAGAPRRACRAPPLSHGAPPSPPHSSPQTGPPLTRRRLRESSSRVCTHLMSSM